MGRIPFTALARPPLFRKMAMGSWRSPGDPSVYGSLEIEMTQALKFMAELKEKSGVKVTPVHLVGKAVAEVLKNQPEINAMVRWRKIYLRPQVDLFFQVNVIKEAEVAQAELAGTVVRKAEALSVIEIAQRLLAQASRIRRDEDQELNRALGIARRVPWALMSWLLHFTTFLNYDLNWNLTWAGIPRDPFGSVMITNVGSLGVAEAWAPLIAYSRVPLLLTVGAVMDRPWVVDGRVEARPVMKIGVTFDHRLMDGTQAAVMSQHFLQCFADPWRYLSSPGTS